MGPLACTLLFWVMTAPALAESGHAVRSTQVAINSRQHWQNWEFPSGTLDISTAGEVTPRRWRKSPNAVLDIVENLRRNPPPYLAGKNPEDFELLDAIQAGSNRQDVVNLFDGNMGTYWEPDPPSGEAGLAAQWWFTVDLGQLALASKVILRFVDKDLGDPFLLFDVLTSDGQRPISALASQALDFERVYQTIRPNSSERLIEIDLENLPRLQHRKRVIRLLPGSGDRKRTRAGDARFHKRNTSACVRRHPGTPESSSTPSCWRTEAKGEFPPMSLQSWKKTEEGRSATTGANVRGWRKWKSLQTATTCLQMRSSEEAASPLRTGGSSTRRCWWTRMR